MEQLSIYATPPGRVVAVLRSIAPGSSTCTAMGTCSSFGACSSSFFRCASFSMPSSVRSWLVSVSTRSTSWSLNPCLSKFAWYSSSSRLRSHVRSENSTEPRLDAAKHRRCCSTHTRAASSRPSRACCLAFSSVCKSCACDCGTARGRTTSGPTLAMPSKLAQRGSISVNGGTLCTMWLPQSVHGIGGASSLGGYRARTTM